MARWRILIIAFLSAMLFIIAVKKAITAAITWDEAFTYFEFIKTGNLFPGAGGGMAANNHLLNTWISYFFTSVFGVNEFTLRLGNLLFYAVYLGASCWLALRSANFSTTLAVFALLNLNPYLFDFFCLSRGYGIAHSCLMLSIVFTDAHFRTCKDVFLKGMILSALTGMLAGAMLLPVFGFLYIIVFYLNPLIESKISGRYQLTNTIKNSLNRLHAGLHLAFIISMIAGATYLIMLQKFNAFLFGGNNGVLNDMIFSIIRNSYYQSGLTTLNYVIAASFFLLLLFSSRGLFKKVVPYFVLTERKTIFVLLLTVISILSLSAIMFYCFSTPLPYERTALYLYILAASLVSINLIDLKKTTWLLSFLCMVTAISFGIHFILSFNLKTFHDWQPDADAPLMITDISASYVKGKSKVINAVASLELELPLRFYLEKKSDLKDRLLISRISYPLKKSEIYFLDKQETKLSDSLENDSNWLRICYLQGGKLFYKSVTVQ